MHIETKKSYYGDRKFKDEFFSSKATKKHTKYDTGGITIIGTFELKDLKTDVVKKYEVGKDIEETDLLMEKIVKNSINTEFETPKGVKVQLISKNLRGKLKKQKKIS